MAHFADEKPSQRICMVEHRVRFGADPIDHTEFGHITLTFSVMAPDTIGKFKLSDYLEAEGLKVLSKLIPVEPYWYLEDWDCE